MAKDLRLADFFVDPIDIHERYHTLLVPLNASEEPPAEWVAKAMVDAFGGLPFARGRLEHAHCDIVTNKAGARAFVARFPRSPLDPPPAPMEFSPAEREAYRLARLNKGAQ